MAKQIQFLADGEDLNPAQSWERVVNTNQFMTQAKAAFRQTFGIDLDALPAKSRDEADEMLIESLQGLWELCRECAAAESHAQEATV
jgi:hypothetical protein